MASCNEVMSPEREIMNIRYASTPIVANQINLNLNRIRNGTVAGLLIQNFNCCRSANTQETDEEIEEFLIGESPSPGRRNRRELKGTVLGDNHFTLSHESSEGSSTLESEASTGGVYESETRNKIVNNLCSYYRRSESRWSPVPWDSGGRHSWEDVYVQAQLQEHDSGRVLDVKNMLTYCRKVLVCGRPGSGLSAMCINLVRAWIGNQQIFDEFPVHRTVVLMLRLRYATSAVSLEDALILLMLNKRKYSDRERHACRNLIETTGKHFVVVLDGYEEASPGLRKQIEQMLRCEPQSVFARASLVVTRACTDGRPCDALSLSLFDRHYTLRDPSGDDCIQLVRKYFSENPDDFYRDNFDQMQMARPHPLLLSLVCSCGGWQPACNNQEAYAELLLFIASQRNADLTQEEVKKRLDSVGKFFWPYARESRHVFDEPTLRNGLGDLFDFARDSGLIKRSDLGVWETSHTALIETTVARHLERSFLELCKTGRFAHFINSNCATVECLNVTFYPVGEGDAKIKAEFEFLQFRFLYQIFDEISGGDQQCRVSVKSLELSDGALEPCHDLCFHYTIALDNAENKRKILGSLRQVFPKCKKLGRLSQFFRRECFTEVRVNFVSVLGSGSNPYLCNFEESLDLSDCLVLCLSDPMLSLRDLSRNCSVVFGSDEACCFQVVKRVLSNWGLLFGDDGREGPLDHVRVIRKDTKFALAVLDFEYTQIRVTRSDIQKRKKTRNEPWSLFDADTSWQSCNRLEVYFGNQTNDGTSCWVVE